MTEQMKVRITAVRRRRIRVWANPLRAACPVCGREVEALTRGQANEILEVEDQKLNELIAAGRVHAIQTVSGSLWVCKDSLF